MKPIIHLESISDINKFVQCTTDHPLVAVFDFSKADHYKDEEMRISTDFYSLIFKNYCANTIRYGRQSLDFQEGSLVCIGPKQVIYMEKETAHNKKSEGWGLFFHPDLLHGTSLGNKLHEYSFFSYEISEALHLSEKEGNILADCVHKIENELQENIDRHSQTLLVSNIELLLNYCTRYYDRQFITRKPAHSKTLIEVNRLLREHFKSKEPVPGGLPTVSYLADRVHLSPGYLSDLLKKETGMNAQDHIHYHLIETAKNKLLGTNETVGQIAFSLGFEYQQYFSKLFKQKTGLTPVEYRKQH